jgi:hypothetical protein
LKKLSNFANFGQNFVVHGYDAAPFGGFFEGTGDI